MFAKSRFFLLVDLQDFFFRFKVGVEGGTKKINKKALTGHFKAFFFLISPEKNSKTSMVNQQSVLNL